MRLISVNPEARMESSQFMQSEFFADILCRSIVFLQVLIEKDEASKIQFFKGNS